MGSRGSGPPHGLKGGLDWTPSPGEVTPYPPHQQNHRSLTPIGPQTPPQTGDLAECGLRCQRSSDRARGTGQRGGRYEVCGVSAAGRYYRLELLGGHRPQARLNDEKLCCVFFQQMIQKNRVCRFVRCTKNKSERTPCMFDVCGLHIKNDAFW